MSAQAIIVAQDFGGLGRLGDVGSNGSSPFRMRLRAYVGDCKRLIEPRRW